MIGISTIGNATLIAYDKSPILSTDPWFGDIDPAYFGSWITTHTFPKYLQEDVFNSKYIWFSHGHPDHLNPESIKKLLGKKLLLPDHVGSRIYKDLIKENFSVDILPDRKWVQLSTNIKVLCITTIIQDAILLVDVNGKLFVNMNDASLRHCYAERFIRNIVKSYSQSYLLALSGYGDTDMINFSNISEFRYELKDSKKIFKDYTNDKYIEQLEALMHDSMYKMTDAIIENEKINNRVDVYKKYIENLINNHNSKQYVNYKQEPSSQKYIYPSIKEHDIFFCYNDIPYNSITSIFFDDIMKIGPIIDIEEESPYDIYEYQFLKYSPNFKRFLKESYEQFLESAEYKEIVLEDSKLNKMYTVYEMKDVNNYIKDRLIEKTYYDILQSIRTKISKLLNNERKRIEQKDIIPKKTGGAKPEHKGEFKLKLSLRDKVMCELEMKDKPRLYEVIGKKKNQFIIYDDNYTTIDLEQKLMTFNIKEEIVKKLLEYNPSINYKR